MKKIMVAILATLVAGCNPTTEVVAIYQGPAGADGTSCSVAPAFSEGEEWSLLGAKISCTDGTYALIYNGQQGVQGAQGIQGIQGPVGEAGASCQAYRTKHSHGVYLSCPDQHPVLISDGDNGKDGKDGDSCKSIRQSDRVKITCGSTVTYVYDGDDGKDGKNGKDGSSCTVTSASGGAKVKCGDGPSVFLANGSPGPQGIQGPQGQPGRDGLNGSDGEDAVAPGLSCNVHNLANWDGITNIFTALSNNAAAGNFTLANFSVGDSQAALGFPGMPSALQALVGVEGYALDCSGYLNVPTSGIYSFSMLSDDGVRLAINDQVIVNNPGLHAPTTDTNSSVTLNRGFNRINVVYYQGPLTQIALKLSWSGPNTASQTVPASAYTH